MSSDIQRDYRVPPTSDPSIRPGSIGLTDAKQTAWAFAIGMARPSHAPPRATQRCDLPDVDFSRAVLAPRHSIWSRIASAFRAPSSEGPASEEVQLETAPVDDLKSEPDNVIPFRRAA